VTSRGHAGRGWAGTTVRNVGSLADMSEVLPTYHWTRDGFLKAWEAGAFDDRVEYVDGEVIPVVIGDWHGRTTMRVARALPGEGVEVSGSTLPAAGSLPDPDCWVRRAGATPAGQLAARLSEWAPDDVLLVVEVSDETVAFDLTAKARLYGSAGFATYWVVTREAVYVHTEPTPAGYRVRTEHRSGDDVPVPYTPATVAVDTLIAG
jgi:hypothetical protein